MFNDCCDLQISSHSTRWIKANFIFLGQIAWVSDSQKRWSGSNNYHGFPANIFCWVKTINIFMSLVMQLTGFCSVQKMISPSLVHYAMGRARGTTLRQCAVLSVLFCSTDRARTAASSPLSTVKWTTEWKPQKHSSGSNPGITSIFYLLHKHSLATASSYLCHRFRALSEHGGLSFWSFVLFQFPVYLL